MMKKTAFASCVLLALLVVPHSKATTESRSIKKVMVMEVKGEIDPRMSRYVKLALEHAQDIKADLVIVDMDTYGGILTDAKDIVDEALSLPIPIWIFINKDAASGGALIAVACDSIYMAPGASIGAATVVTPSGKTAPDKYQSYMRAVMRSAAEAHGRNPDIAEAMVDETLGIEGLAEPGEVVTMTTSEALQYGYCEAEMNSIDEILTRNGQKPYQLIPFELAAADRIIAFFINPFISGLLILLILGGLYFELQTPGVGFPLALAAVALVLYLVPYYLNGLAESWEIIALFLGVVLLALEIFVIPGFGAAGIAGIALVLTSLLLIMLDNDFLNFDTVPYYTLVKVTLSVLCGFIGAIIVAIIATPKVSQLSFLRGVSLTATQDVSEGYTAMTYSRELVGKTGVAHTVLRPGGKVMIDDVMYDAFSAGDYIDQGASIEALAIEGNTVRVKKINA